MVAKIDETGNIYGLLKVIREGGRTKAQKAKWICQCDCGQIVEVVGNLLRKGITKSCGCLRVALLKEMATTHGMTGSPIYYAWQDTNKKCYYKKHHSYRDYGGRGIKVCWRWHRDNPKGFQNFYDDMIGTWEEGLQLNRIDNEGGYCPENCNWVTPAENNLNKRTTIRIGDIPVKKWVDTKENILELEYKTIRKRLQRGWTEADAIYTPYKQKRELRHQTPELQRR